MPGVSETEGCAAQSNPDTEARVKPAVRTRTGTRTHTERHGEGPVFTPKGYQGIAAAVHATSHRVRHCLVELPSFCTGLRFALSYGFPVGLGIGDGASLLRADRIQVPSRSHGGRKPIVRNQRQRSGGSAQYLYTAQPPELYDHVSHHWTGGRACICPLVTIELHGADVPTAHLYFHRKMEVFDVPTPKLAKASDGVSCASCAFPVFVEQPIISMSSSSSLRHMSSSATASSCFRRRPISSKVKSGSSCRPKRSCRDHLGTSRSLVCRN